MKADVTVTLLSSFFILHPCCYAERSHSGLVHRSRKPEWVNAHRGFESHPLRQKCKDEVRRMQDEIDGSPSIWKLGRLSSRCELSNSFLRCRRQLRHEFLVSNFFVVELQWVRTIVKRSERNRPLISLTRLKERFKNSTRRAIGLN
jgi:hypothetical protein